MEIAFLFGAGAEAEFGICSGNEFAKSVLAIEKTKVQRCINVAVQNHYTDILARCRNNPEHPDWYPVNCYAPSFNIDTLLRNSIKKKRLANNAYKESIASFEKDIRIEANKIRKIKDKIDVIYTTPNYMGILDANFHTIIAPRALGPQKFWQVVMAITRAYLAICFGLLSIPMNNNRNLKFRVNDILKNPQTAYMKMIAAINESNGKFQKDSYYRIIGNTFKAAKRKVNIITTNYTPVAEEIICDEINDIAYIHGHIKLFESPYYLHVTDVSKQFESDKFEQEINFPYLFLQSGVKPIVENTQIKAFSTALSILNECDVLFILGYDFNCDDNHINSLLHNFLHIKNNKSSERVKEIVFFDYCHVEDIRMDVDDRKKELLDRLRIPENNRLSTISKVNFKIVPINASDSKRVLMKTIKEYLLA